MEVKPFLKAITMFILFTLCFASSMLGNSLSYYLFFTMVSILIGGFIIKDLYDYYKMKE